MDIEYIKQLDFVKQLEAEGFTVYFSKLETSAIILYGIKRGDFVSTINEFHYEFVGVDMLKRGMEMQKQAIEDYENNNVNKF